MAIEEVGMAPMEAALVSVAGPETPLALTPVGTTGETAVAVEAGVDLVDVIACVELVRAAGAGTVMSKGGLYSYVPVRSSIILMPYLLPAGIFAESSKVPGTVHV